MLDGSDLARQGRWRVRRLRGAAPGQPDGAGRGDLRPAASRADARLSLLLPRRHVRLVRDDGQRRRALDLPHARRQSRDGRHADDRAARELAGGPGPRRPTCASSSTSGRARRDASRAAATRHDDFARVAAAVAGARRGERGHRMHRLRRLPRVLRRRRAGAPISSARPRSTARGRSSTTSATRRSASACARSPATRAATPATRRARAPSVARAASSRRRASRG